MFFDELCPSLLMEVRATDTNIMEVKTVAGFVSYKICKLAFRLNLPRDAISQFRKHMDIFQQKVGMDGEFLANKFSLIFKSDSRCTCIDKIQECLVMLVSSRHPGAI